MNPDLICYKQMPVWHAADIPAAFLARHNTQEGTWGKLRVLTGRLKFHLLDGQDNILSTAEITPESGVHTIEPQQWHKIEALSGDLAMQLEFHCDKADYFHKKYGMTATHSAVKAAAARVPPCKALDLGCGQGRNALYLALKGFEVTAADQNPAPLYALSDLAAQENLPVQPVSYDINTAALEGQYGFIAATVVFMFLRPERIPAIIADMQAHTLPGGFNLIVSAMDTPDFPCPMPFPFKFKENELRGHYAGWEMAEYNEELGAMHATDSAGNPIRFKFVTMLAKKPG
ncbi:Tellurite resistance protein TehB homolog [Kingella potus]|uniref:Tellurite resistance protein TehB homolog n=1 Tax=Kingella potus TaxID=265175 RepID=A0A377R112_9NEIS|nr:SAM-dependent methyltransferase TehB [Kingella potus]STR00011.1 Tellurite resistance protein TehB homolog [Kingella potus]